MRTEPEATEAREETLPHYFARVLDCDSSGEVVIPYRSGIEFSWCAFRRALVHRVAIAGSRRDRTRRVDKV